MVIFLDRVITARIKLSNFFGESQGQNEKKLEISRSIYISFFFLLILFALYFSISIFLVSLIGIGLGVLISPILTVLKEKFSLPRGLSAMLLILFTIILAIILSYSIWFLVFDQMKGLIERAPETAKNLNEKISLLLDQYPWLKEKLDGFSVTTAVKDFATRLFAGLRIGFEVLAGLAFAFVLAIYTAISLPEYFLSSPL
jgi:predicted PurR-regulated permease PerM